MEFIELNETELSNVIGGTLEEVKEGFFRTIKKPVTNVSNMINERSFNNEHGGEFLGCAALLVMGYLAPWVCHKIIKVKETIFN